MGKTNVNYTNPYKLNAYMINSIIKFNIDELVTYLEDNHPTMDIYNVKRTYIHVQPNGGDLENALAQFIIDKLNDMDEGGNDIENTVRSYIEVFFDITRKNDDVYIVERMENN